MSKIRLAVLLLLCCLVGVGILTVTATASVQTYTDGPAVDAGEPAALASVTPSDRLVSQQLASAHVDTCAATPPADHADPPGGTSETIGWVDGYWYSEALDIEGPAIDEDELEALVARTAARVEALRCLTFDEVPPTELLTREEYGTSVEAFFTNLSTDEWRFDDARLATLLIAGQAVDAKELRIEAQTAFPAAFYDTEEQYMGFITDDPSTIEINQVTLAHELLHALQDQHFDLRQIFDEPTNDRFISSLAVVEGDAVLVDSQYEANCDGAWSDACILTQPSAPGEIPSYALVLNQLAAYNMPLVEAVYDEDGWDGVNALLDEMPDSTIETLYPEQYGSFQPVSLTVADESGSAWERIAYEGPTGEEITYDVIGQHGLTAILVAPSFETQGNFNIVNPFDFQPHVGGDFNYDVPETSGWEGDKLYAYANDAGDNASVWKLAWSDSDEAETFADAYTELIEYRGGSLADGYENVYTFDQSDEYEMAVAIERAGDRLLIVTAPTVDALTEVHAGITLLDADDVDPTPTPIDETPTHTPDADRPSPTPLPHDTPTPSPDGIPGFGVVITVIIVLAVTLLAHRFRS